MSYYIDIKYINCMASRLSRFAWKKNDLAVCRCPVCGDSQKNKLKTRFYFYQKKGQFFVRCHNCAYSTTFSKFLEGTDAELYSQYRVETFTDSGMPAANKDAAFIEAKPAFNGADVDYLRGISSIAELPDDHYAKQYVMGRRIPVIHHGRLYFAENFSVVADRLNPDGKHPRDPRLVIPFYDSSGKLFAIQGRSFLPDSSLRYITVRIPDSDMPKIYGLERLNPKARNYCVEGPLDSLFLSNTIAMAGFSASLDSVPFDTSNTVFILDNEPRNREILKQMSRLIEDDRKLCIWPSTVAEKDINDMVLAGYDVLALIEANTCQGLLAKLRFDNWRKM